MRALWWVLMLVLSTSQAWGLGPVLKGKCRISWNAPTTNVNGTPLEDLDGYAVFVTQMQGVYDWSTPDDRVQPQKTQVKCPPEAIVEDGQYYAVVRAIDSLGRLGLPSNEFAFVIRAKPGVAEERSEVEPSDVRAPMTPGERRGW